MVVCDAVSRNIDGVLGNVHSLDLESYENALLEAPSFTKPSEYNGLKVPKELLSGNHKKIHEYKINLSECKTKYYNPTLFIK